ECSARRGRELARPAPRLGRLGRHRLRRALAQGSVDAGRSARSGLGRRRRGAPRDDPSSRQRGRGRHARRAPREALAVTWRDLMCGETRPEHVGRELTLAGWAARRRDHGGLVFVDLRDHTGITQLVVNPERSPAAAEIAKEIRNEFVLRARGEVVARAAETVNPAMATGAVELQVDELEIVSRSTPLPFQLDEEGVDETLRLRYRWLDLRRDKLQRNLRLRAQMVRIIRRHMEEA